jgi:hypothetical protein
MENKLENDIQIDKKTFYKMLFCYNALNRGWNIKKENEEFIFTKPHENKQEIYDDDYISQFIKDNINYKNLFKE